MIVPLAALIQGVFGRIVHHSELVEQGLDDLSGTSAGADVQVLDRVSGQVEGGSLLTAAVPSWTRGGDGGGGDAAGRGKRHGPCQLKQDLNKASVRAVTVLQTSRKTPSSLTLTSNG